MMRRFLSNSNSLCKSCNTRFHSSTSALQQQFQQNNKHFVIIQWPNNEVSLKLDNRKTAQEHDEFFNDISQYAESQLQRLHNLKPKPQQQPSPLEFSHHPSRQLDALLSNKSTSHTAPCTYSVQLNSITMFDSSILKSANSPSPSAVVVVDGTTEQQVTIAKTRKSSSTKKQVKAAATQIKSSAPSAATAVASGGVNLEQLIKEKKEMFVMQEVKRHLQEQQQKMQQQTQQQQQQQEKKQALEEEEEDQDVDQQALATEESTASVTVEQA